MVVGLKTLFLSAATDAGVNIDGAKEGAILLGKYLENNNENVLYIKNSDNFIKDKSKDNLKKNLEEVNYFNEKLYNSIVNNKDYFPITIGGDHSISIGSALASAKNNKNIGIIWFDAHPDFNTFKTTITGNIHGLPLAAIAGLEKDLTKFHNHNYVKPENICIVGARSIDPLELKNLEAQHIKVFTTEDIKTKGITYCLEEAIKIASSNTLGIHISYDLDVIDPFIAPGVSVPEVNGITKEEAIKALEIFLKDMPKVVSIDLVEFNSLNDKNNQTYDIAIKLLKMMKEKIEEK